MQQSGEKKMNKMMYSTQWEPFFKLPKKQELRANNFRGPKSSLYTRDYVAQSLDGRGAMMRNDLYTTKQKRDAMDMRTTMKVSPLHLTNLTHITTERLQRLAHGCSR